MRTRKEDDKTREPSRLLSVNVKEQMFKDKDVITEETAEVLII